jgi:4-amino-4-deoxychorismate lyase
MQFWYDGQAHQGSQICLEVTDPGLLYGATVFSTLRVYGNLDHPLTNWQQHCDRLHNSLRSFGWQPPDWARLLQGARWMAQTYPVLRLTIFPDGREWITGRALPADLAQRQTDGITAWVAQGLGVRSLPEHKTGNYLTPWLGLQQLGRQQSEEAILTNGAGHWLETLTGNLWGWANGIWYTPSLEVGILPGILRDRLLQRLNSHHKIVEECVWDDVLVNQLEALAYSNCIVEIVPIRAVLRQNSHQSLYDPAHNALDELRQMLFSGYSEMS